MSKKKHTKSENKRLKQKVSKLRKKLKTALKAGKLTAQVPLVSPLAPESGFPELPAIKGVRFAATAAGVKYQGRLDVMLAEIASDSTIAGVFTTSSTRSAPVLDCQEKLALLNAGSLEGGPFGILVNSGNSNAFTGQAGFHTVAEITKAVSTSMGTDNSKVFTASTGVIGEPLPHDRIIKKINELTESLAADKAEDAANAIMTTDTFAKGSHTTVTIDGTQVRIAGFAKGSGMIAPDMATMLVFIFTDAKISQNCLQTILSDLNRATFNCITVDGDTSTSDSLILAATGAAEMKEISSPDELNAETFASGLKTVMLDLAQQVVRDGEGATKFIEINVTGATSNRSAHRIAMSIANSPLVKTACAGEDPNWGRVVMAVGKSGEPAERDKLTIFFGDILVAENGWVASSYSEAAGSEYMRSQNLSLSVDLGLAKGAATAWTCDLTHQYITINADYRS